MENAKSNIEDITCPACGSHANREGATFCLDCGKLMSEDYQPLDAIRSSYGLQQKNLAVLESDAETADLFERNTNTAADTAWACVVYAMVPYLGILFVPVAFATGGLGYFVSYRHPHLGGRKMAAVCVALSVFVLAVQIFLWWLLYIIPEIGN
jgi:hypothetical protein